MNRTPKVCEEKASPRPFEMRSGRKLSKTALPTPKNYRRQFFKNHKGGIPKNAFTTTIPAGFSNWNPAGFAFVTRKPDAVFPVPRCAFQGITFPQPFHIP
jgi:hypothetical protein